MSSFIDTELIETDLSSIDNRPKDPGARMPLLHYGLE
jgi:hypothetical protein